MEEAGIVGDDGHFRTVIARLVEHSILKLHKYVCILFEYGIKVPVVILWLWGGAMDPRVVTFRHSCYKWTG